MLIFWRPCKAKKVKCGEEKPGCLNCQRQGEACDYSIRLNWDGRTKRKAGGGTLEPSTTTPNAAIAEKYGNAKRGELDAQSRNTESPPHHSDQSGFTVHKPSPFSLENHSNPTITNSTTNLPVAPSGSGQDGNITSSNSSSSSVLDATEDGPEVAELGNQTGARAAPVKPFAAHIPRLTDLCAPIMLPSPEQSSLDSPGLNGILTTVPTANSQSTSMGPMLPPYYIPPQNSHSNSRKDRNYSLSPENRAKRIRLSPLSGFAQSAGLIDTQAYDNSSILHAQATQIGFVTPQAPSSPYNSNIGTPLTPASSSATSSDPNPRTNTATSPYVPQISPDIRRLSVNSLLSGPPGDGPHTVTHVEHLTNISVYPVPDIGTDTVTYGLDRGFPDLDVQKNDDRNALNGMSPALVNDEREVMVQNRFGDDFYVPTEFGFGLQAKDTVFGKGGYYAKPVPVKIPRSLEPLPATLLQNPMNLLYFHHFLNHTARILVPHDCSENPFRKILPQSKPRPKGPPCC